MITTLLELVGFASITYGSGLIWHPLLFIIGGLLLVLVAYLADRGQHPRLGAER